MFQLPSAVQQCPQSLPLKITMHYYSVSFLFLSGIWTCRSMQGWLVSALVSKVPSSGDEDCWRLKGWGLSATLYLSPRPRYMGQCDFLTVWWPLARSLYGSSGPQEAGSGRTSLIRPEPGNWHCVTSAIFCWPKQSQSHLASRKGT